MKGIIERLNNNFDLTDFKEWKFDEITNWVKKYFKLNKRIAEKVAKYIEIKNDYIVFYNADCQKYDVKVRTMESGYLHYTQIIWKGTYTYYKGVAEKWKNEVEKLRVKRVLGI